MSDKLFAWSVVADKTDVSIPFRLLSTAGAAVTGKVATNLTLSYWRQGGTRTAITASDLAAVNSAHSDGGVKEVDSTNLPGLYRLDLPDAAVASGADWVVIGVVCSGAMDSETLFAIQSAGTVEIYSRIGAPAGASVSADIAALPSAATIATAVWAAASRTLTSISALASELRAAVGLASANLDTQLDALPTANENADALLDRSSGIETSITLRQALRLVLAASAGKLSGAAGATVTIRNVGDSKDRIVATVDADGNRTAVTTDVT